jgi:hypothetical protein
MNREKIIILGFILLFLILSSGCVFDNIPFDSQTPVGSGIVIESFRTEPELSEVYSNEETTFVLKFRNTGSVKAENCFVELLGLDQLWKGRDDTRKNPRNQEVFPYEKECQYDQRGNWIVLLPPDPSAGIEGGDKICTWGYTAPDVLPGLYADYVPRARVFYDYKSFLIKTITLLPTEELKLIQNQGKGLPVETTSESGSPVSLDIEARSPIRTYGQTLTFPMVIKIENVGGGTVCKDSERCRKYTEGGAEWNVFKLYIKLPEGMSFETGSCTGDEDIYLVMGKSQTITCKVKVNEIPERLTQKNIQLTAEYGYFIDKTTKIRVLPSG